MENKIIYVSQEVIHSNKKNQDYYVIYYIMNKKPVTDFVSEETYKKILIKKPQDLKEYDGVFKITAVGNNKSIVLNDIR